MKCYLKTPLDASQEIIVIELNRAEAVDVSMGMDFLHENITVNHSSRNFAEQLELQLYALLDYYDILKPQLERTKRKLKEL